MIRLLSWLPFFKKKDVKKDDENTLPSKKEICYETQRVSFPFLTMALLFFAGQVVLASVAALEFVFPNFALPVPFNLGRSIHVNLSIYWPIMGIMGGVYYILPEETGRDLNRPRLALIHFFFLTITLLALYGTLTFGLTDGREYLEGIRPIKIMIAINLLLFVYIVISTIAKRKTKKWHPTMVGLMLGLSLSLLMYVPSVLFFPNIVLDEFFRFWTVHIWVESTLELVVASVLASILLLLTGMQRKQVERWYYVEVFLVLLTGFLGVGHHYFWIGVSSIWQTVGAIFGAMQVIPVFFLAMIGYKVMKEKEGLTGDALVVKYLAATVFWNVLGAGGLGFLMTFPGTNKYLHGTEMVDAHAHLALFGTYGFLLIALAYFILPQSERFKNLSMTKGNIAFHFLNVGVAVIGISLIVAGIVQAYLWRYLGMDFVTVREIIKPYMIGRAIGGGIFAVGGLLIGWDVVTNLVSKKSVP